MNEYEKLAETLELELAVFHGEDDVIELDPEFVRSIILALRLAARQQSNPSAREAVMRAANIAQITIIARGVDGDDGYDGGEAIRAYADTLGNESVSQEAADSANRQEDR